MSQKISYTITISNAGYVYTYPGILLVIYSNINSASHSILFQWKYSGSFTPRPSVSSQGSHSFVDYIIINNDITLCIGISNCFFTMF